MKRHHLFLILFFASLLFLCSCTQATKPIEKPKLVEPISTSSPSGILNKTTTIFQDSQNRYWFGGDQKGLYLYQNGDLSLFTLEDGLAGTSILGIQEDHLGHIYFDAMEGISKFDGQGFSTLELTHPNASQNEWKLEPQDLWFRMGWNHSGPFRYDGTSLYALQFPKTDQEAIFRKQYPNVSFNPYGIYSSYQDKRGHQWFGTSSLGVCRFDGETIQWLYEDQLTSTPSGGAFGFRSTIEDQDGYFWFCNTRYRYKIEEADSAAPTNQLAYERIPGIEAKKQNGKSLFPYFMSAVEDQAGDLWMLTYSDGVFRKSGDQLIHYPVSVLLFSIYMDKQGDIWLGTHQAGAWKFNGTTFEQFKPTSPKDESPKH